MSSSMNLIGFRPPDETFRKMKAVWYACVAAGVDPPDEVSAFFEDDPENADEQGVPIDLTRPEFNMALGVTEFKDDTREGYQVDLRQLDPSIKVLRFFMSW